MVNSEDFIKRLEEIFHYHGISASVFADRINVQRSSISHLLSGRNKPSLEFVLKVVKAFPEVDLYWLLQGKGTFPMDHKKLEDSAPTDPMTQNQLNEKSFRSEKQIDRIIILYNDGSFESFNPFNH
ncbi:helix-turn-helix domain-containing protein [Maribacter algicola]|uniref:Helix-turn-helix domain-containing protein n=1 Tax=Meishania litoralis TaxID=3434685 RepID=A0ACC7LJM9_9FLAO